MWANSSRRKFFVDCGRATLGFSSLSLAGCSHHALIADLETRLPALLAQSPTVPAVSMALVADAKLLWRGAFGVKDFESKTPVGYDTVFEAGSVSKTVFAYAVMKLCDRVCFIWISR
jgi:CubicO group peptidase (beta-lactamase class C family)